MPWPSYVWDGQARQYRDPRGKFVSRGKVREALDGVIDVAAADMEAVARRLQAGQIEIGDFQAEMERLLKIAHVAAGASASGGWAQATPETWSAVGNRLKTQYQYLRDFSRQLQLGYPLDGRFIARAGMYGLSATSTYESILRRADLAAGFDLERRVLHPGKSEACPECVGYSALGWQPAGTLPDIGEASRCLTRCRCSFSRRRSGSPNALPRVSPTTGTIVAPFAAPEIDFDVPGTVAGPEVEFGGDFKPVELEPDQPRGWWSRLVEFATKGRLPRKAHAGLNSGCGTGAGGFKPGNTCGRRAGAHGTGRGGTQKHRKALAEKIRALRGQAKTPEQRKQLVAAIRTLKAHERGQGDAGVAAKIRRAIHAGKAPKVADAGKTRTAREAIRQAIEAKRQRRGLSAGERKDQAGRLRDQKKAMAAEKAKADRRTKIREAVAARHRQRGLTDEQRKTVAAGLKTGRKILGNDSGRRAELIGDALEQRRKSLGVGRKLRSAKVRLASALTKSGKSEAGAGAKSAAGGKALKPEREALVEHFRNKVQGVLDHIKQGARPLRTGADAIDEARGVLKATEFQELHRRLGLGKVAAGKAEQSLRDAIAGRIKDTPGHADLRERLRGAAWADQTAISREWLDERMVAAAKLGKPVPRAVHGMTDAEPMHAVDFEGVRFHVPLSGVGRANAESTINRMAIGKPIPEALSRHTRDVYFSAQDNNRDGYWKAQYKGFTKSAGTGGDGDVVFYAGGSGDVVLAHEMGHNLANGKYGSTHPKAGSDFRKAIDSGEPVPTEYGRNSHAEDFAESVMLYHIDPARLKSGAPKRHAVIERLMKDPHYGG